MTYCCGSNLRSDPASQQNGRMLYFTERYNTYKAFEILFPTFFSTELQRTSWFIC